MPAPPVNMGNRFANENIGLMIQCIQCGVKCFHGRFSNKQLDQYREAVARQRRGGRVADLPRCANCSPQCVSELHCVVCLLTKDLLYFSKAQRKTPDNAKCEMCVQEGLDRLAQLESAMEEERILDEKRGTSVSGVTSVSGSATDSLPRPQTQSSTTNSAIYLPDEGGSAWGKGSVRSSSPTNTEVSDARSTSTYTGNTSKRSFARQGAYQPPIQARVDKQLEREAKQKQEAQFAAKHDDDEDDDGDDWEL